MTLGGNLSNLSGLMISVAHPPQVVPRSQHMPLYQGNISWLRNLLLIPSLAPASISHPSQGRKYGWHDYPATPARCIIHLILYLFLTQLGPTPAE